MTWEEREQLLKEAGERVGQLGVMVSELRHVRWEPAAVLEHDRSLINSLRAALVEALRENEVRRVRYLPEDRAKLDEAEEKLGAPFTGADFARGVRGDRYRVAYRQHPYGMQTNFTLEGVVEVEAISLNEAMETVADLAPDTDVWLERQP